MVPRQPSGQCLPVSPEVEGKDLRMRWAGSGLTAGYIGVHGVLRRTPDITEEGTGEPGLSGQVPADSGLEVFAVDEPLHPLPD
ncbi:MAG: hypothetical protein ACOX8D_11125, partial [Methanoculleus sp.]